MSPCGSCCWDSTGFLWGWGQSSLLWQPFWCSTLSPLSLWHDPTQVAPVVVFYRFLQTCAAFLEGWVCLMEEWSFGISWIMALWLLPQNCVQDTGLHTKSISFAVCCQTGDKKILFIYVLSYCIWGTRIGLCGQNLNKIDKRPLMCKFKGTEQENGPAVVCCCVVALGQSGSNNAGLWTEVCTVSFVRL